MEHLEGLRMKQVGCKIIRLDIMIRNCWFYAYLMNGLEWNLFLSFDVRYHYHYYYISSSDATEEKKLTRSASMHGYQSVHFSVLSRNGIEAELKEGFHFLKW